MHLKSNLILLFILLLKFGLSAQDKNNSISYPNGDETPYYFKDGIKMSKKNNTPLVLSNLNYKADGDTPEKMALSWIKSNQQLLKIDRLKDLKVKFLRNSPSGQTIRFHQFMDSIPIYNSEIVIHISPKKEITYVSNTFDPSIQKINTPPSLSKESAFELAKNKINVKGNISFNDIKLMIYNNLNTSKLIYKTQIEATSPIGSWEILVDAQNGEIIHAVDKAFYAHRKNMLIPINGSGNVFLSDPLSFANVTYGGNYSDNNDVATNELNTAISTVTLLDIDQTGSIFTLKGPFAEIQDFESPFRGLFTQSTSNFNFNRSDDAFEAVNCYYLIDQSMRYINQTLGISLMPFQYSSGVRFDPHGLNGADNSYFLTGSGSLSFGEGGVDDAEDADVIIHELGHGIHQWLIGGSPSNVEGLAEGSGDYWAQSYSRSLNQWGQSDEEYHWMFNWDGHNPFFQGRITNYTNTYPGGLVSDIHIDGQIWSSALMRIYDLIGREKLDKAFLEGLAMTNNSSNQQDAAIAVRQAAIDMGYNCSDIAAFTNEFNTTGYTLPSLDVSSFKPAISDTSQCQGISAIISANEDNLNWYDDPLLTNLVNTGSTFNTGQSTEGTYTYYVKYNDPICTTAGIDTVTLTISTAICTSIDENNIDNFIRIYPNPTAEQITIDLKDYKLVQRLVLTDNLGRTIQEIIPTTNKFIVSLRSFSKGIYSLAIHTNSNTIAKKIIKN